MKHSTLRKTLFASTLCLFALNGMVNAQKCILSGNVKEAISGENLPFANVALMRTADSVFVRGATTDMDGNFTIVEADTGRYLLRATCVGFQTFFEPIHLTSNMVGMAISLNKGVALQEVSIVADRPLYSMDGEKNLYNVKEDPSVQTGTASDALQNAPGVEVDAEGNITLRGVSSVEIWINDRPSHMQTEALKQYIKQMPAGAIERIEVITNPSARYSTSGGVINIVTGQKISRNELLCFGVRARTSPSISPWASYVYANEKFDLNLYVNADYSQHRSSGAGSSTLLTNTGDTSRFQSWNDTNTSSSIGGYTGLNINWTIDEHTQLGAWLGVYPYWSKSSSMSDYAYLEYLPSPINLGYSNTSTTDAFFWGGYGGAYLTHLFDSTGRRLMASLNGNIWSNSDLSDEERTYYDPARAALARHGDYVSNSPSLGAELNYTHPMSHGWEAEAGISTSLSNNDSYLIKDTIKNGTYVNDKYQTYDVRNRNIGAALYLTLQKRWGSFTAKVGLRGEASQMHSESQHPNLDYFPPVDTLFLTPVPSLHLSYLTKDFQSYSLSYTLRSSTPGASQLSDFRTYGDYSFSTGNPNLLISYTHNLEASWSKFFSGFGNVGINAYFRANTNEVGTMTAVIAAPEYYGSALVNYTYPDNIGSSHTEGIEANITYRPTAMVNVRLNTSVYNYGYTYNGFSDSKVSWNARLNVWGKFWGWLEVFANAHYSSPHIGLYSLSVANKGIDFGMSTDILDRRMSIFLNVNDIFGMAEWGENTTAPQYQTTGSSRYDSRFVSLGLTWRIGKMELENKARQGASETPQM